MDKNPRQIGGYNYTNEEKAFATKIQESFTGTVPKIESTSEIAPYQVSDAGGVGGSTDVADISWGGSHCRFIHCYMGTWYRSHTAGRPWLQVERPSDQKE